MNEKLLKLARDQGYCCLWAFLEANRSTYTSELVRLAKEAGFPLTIRAIRYRRRAYRDGTLVCTGSVKCLKERLRQARKTP